MGLNCKDKCHNAEHTEGLSISMINHQNPITKFLTLLFLSCCPAQFDQWCPFSEWQDGPKPSSSLPSQWCPPPPFLWWPVDIYSPMSGKHSYIFLIHLTAVLQIMLHFYRESHHRSPVSFGQSCELWLVPEDHFEGSSQSQRWPQCLLRPSLSLNLQLLWTTESRNPKNR